MRRWRRLQRDAKPDPVERVPDDFTAADAEVWERVQPYTLTSLNKVEALIRAVEYIVARHFVEGPVEQTIPMSAPEEISLLRLDTDWYASTRHELVHLYPRLASGGVLIIDDYAYWRGARQAVDEYIHEHGLVLLLIRVDGARFAVTARP